MARSKGVDERLKALDRLLSDGRPRSVIETSCVQRQINDLEQEGRNGLHWDEEAADRSVRFFGLLKHWKGEWGGKRMELQPWQEHCIIAPLFGWMCEDGRRRFRTGYIEVPRKAGKTTLAAGLALQGAVADAEPGAEVYCAATKRDQATILFRDVKEMIGPKLKQHVTVLANAVMGNALNSTIKPLSSDYNSLDGLNSHRAVVDELHAHKTRGLWDVMLTAQGARRQPMLIAITTAGFDRSSICWEQRQHAISAVQQGADDSYFAFIAATDDDDDWQDENTWWKANPNLGISPKRDYLEGLCRQAMESPAAENNFRRKHLNQWTESDVRWLPMVAWDKCGGPFDLSRPEGIRMAEQALRGRRCTAGLDLSTTRDVNALVLAFPDDDGGVFLLPYMWLPRDAVDQRAEQDGRMVRRWGEAGYISLTPGNTSDYTAIRHQVMQCAEMFDLEGVAYDSWGPAAALVQGLQDDGFAYDRLLKFRQNMSSYAAPVKEFERLVHSGKLQHGNHPVMRWMAGNVTAKIDPAGNIMPDKGKSGDKIDGIVSAIMAVGIGMGQGGEHYGTGEYYEANEMEIW